MCAPRTTRWLPEASEPAPCTSTPPRVVAASTALLRSAVTNRLRPAEVLTAWLTITSRLADRSALEPKATAALMTRSRPLPSRVTSALPTTGAALRVTPPRRRRVPVPAAGGAEETTAFTVRPASERKDTSPPLPEMAWSMVAEARKSPETRPPEPVTVPPAPWEKLRPVRVMMPPPVVERGAFTTTSPVPRPSVSALTVNGPPLAATAPPMETVFPARRRTPPEPLDTPPRVCRLWPMPRDSRRTEAAPAPPEASTSEPAVLESNPLAVVMSTPPPAVVMSFWMASAPAPVTSALNAPPEVVIGPARVMALSEASVTAPPPLARVPAPRLRVVPAVMFTFPPFDEMASMISTRPVVPVTDRVLFCAVRVPPALPVTVAPERVKPPPPDTAAPITNPVVPVKSTNPLVLVMERETVAFCAKVPVMPPVLEERVPVPP